MSPQLQLATITADFLNSSESAVVLPELQSLKQTIENNSGHDHQSVFDHTVAVMRGMEQMFVAEFLAPADRATLHAHLNQKFTTQSRQDLLRLLVIVHDLAKPEALVTNPDGTNGCPAHEILSAARTGEFQERFGLATVETEWVQQLVRLHGLPHGLLSVGLAKPENTSQIITTFATGVGDGALELILMVYADLIGGDLATLNPPEFKARTALCQTWLKQLVSTIA